MSRKNCPTCGQFSKANHRCKGKVIPGVPTALIRPKGYNPKELSNVLRGLKGNHKLGYNASHEADKMDRAMKPAKGVVKRIKRNRLRASLETRFGIIDWKESSSKD